MEDFDVTKQAFTYLNIIETKLMVALIDGSPTEVSRGWGQSIEMSPGQLSFDPDDLENKVRK